MRLTFYKSALCPRCAQARKSLYALVAANPEINVEEVDVMSAPLRTWREGIRMIPALKDGERVLSGLFLSRQAITDFLDGGSNG